MIREYRSTLSRHSALDKKFHSESIDEADEGAFAPNHYCVHHGGVQHEGRIIEAEAIQHNYDFNLGKVTHYDMKLPDGTILEDVAAEDILITKASLAEGHPGKREKGQGLEISPFILGKRDEKKFQTFAM